MLENKVVEKKAKKEPARVMKFTERQLEKMKEFSKYSKDYMRVLLPEDFYTKEDALKILKNYFKEE